MKNEQAQQNLSLQHSDNNHELSIYGGSSSLKLTESEAQKLSAKFADEDYEIRPDGFIYVPQALIRKRLNDVIGNGQWSINLIKTVKEEINGKFKVYFDGYMMIRGCFVSRSTGESMYNPTNPNSSWGTAQEGAKSDCFVRCVKDLGVALEVYEPQFVRKWQKNFAKKVRVQEPGKQQKILWRRIDVDPYDYETGDYINTPHVPPVTTKTNTTEKGWLNHGPEYDLVLKQLFNQEISFADLYEKYMLSKETSSALKSLLVKEWAKNLAEIKTLPELVVIYNNNKEWIDKHDFIKQLVGSRRTEILNTTTASV